MKLFHLNKVKGWKSFSFNAQKRNKAKNDSEENFYNLLVNAAFGIFLQVVRNRLKLELTKKDDIKKSIKQQSKLTFNGFHII